MMKIGIVASSLLKSVFDSFTRTTSGSLGTSTSGAAWTALRGTWYANGSQARSDDAGSNYSLATVAIGTDTTTSSDVSGGVGVAFWVSDAGSWWAVVPYYTETANSTCTNGNCSGTESFTFSVSNCNNGACSGTETYQGPSTCEPYSSQCSGNYVVQTSNCTSGACSGTESYTQTCSCTTNTICQYGTGTGSFAAANCAAAGGTYSAANGGTCCIPEVESTCPNGACSGTQTLTRSCMCSYSSISCSCPTQVRSCSCTTQSGTRTCSCTYTQAYALRLLSSVGGVVSTATSDVSLPSAATAVKVITAGNVVTAQAYSDSAMTATLGNALIHTATSPTKGPSTGLVKSPVPYLQGSTADNFSSGA